MKTVTTITHLTGTKTENAPWLDRGGSISQVLDIPKDHLPRKMTLSHAGLMLTSPTGARLAIPIAELWALAEGHEPTLKTKRRDVLANRPRHPRQAAAPPPPTQ